jgi:signal transduction histidine kinase
VTGSDVAVTAALGILGLYGTGPASAEQGIDAPAGAYVLMAAACLPVLIARWRPLVAFGATATVVGVYLALGFALGPILASLAVVAYGLGLRVPMRRALTVAAVGLGVIMAAVAVGVLQDTAWWPYLPSTASWLLIPLAAGVAVKVRRDAATAVRAEQGRRAASEERLTWTQEVHDIVGHGLAVVALQAGVALRVLERDPGQARAALEAIRATSREALDALRAEIDALRGADAPLRPATGLADLPDLAARLRSGGLPVAVTVADRAGDAPAEVQRAAYRIVQESLSNVLKHGGPDASARVAIERVDGLIRVEVNDTGRGGPVADGGHGLAGMRARAEALGGTFTAGPGPGGGFLVVADLPAHRDGAPPAVVP